MTKSALTQARAKLNPWAFIRLNEVAAKSFYDYAEHYLWHGHRLLASDGTTFRLPNHPSVIEEFGQHNFGPYSDSKRSIAMGSMLYDVLNQVTLDAQIGPYTATEPDLLIKHLEKAEKGDLLLLDRGYPSYWLLFLLKAKGMDFCIRMRENWWLAVKDFNKSDEKQRIVNFKLPKNDRSKLKAYPDFNDNEITCRLIKIELPTGENEILCASLLDEEKYPFADFESLYHYRWNEEEAYKLLKNRVELENFSGKTARAIQQDFHAKIFLMTLCATYAHPIEEKVKEEYKADKERVHDQKINRTNALSMTQEILVSVFIRKQYVKALAAFDEIVSKTREIIRPKRRNPRRIMSGKKGYSINYKRL